MNLEDLSTRYTVKTVTDRDIPSVYQLAVQNPMFYQYCPPAVTCDSIKQDMMALPPGKLYSDKYYMGFWDQDQLIAVMDLILKYPDDATVWIGFFMVNKGVQFQGIGSLIITELCDYLKSEGYASIRLGYAKGNPQSEAFWSKNRFIKTGTEIQADDYVTVVMERKLGFASGTHANL